MKILAALQERGTRLYEWGDRCTGGRLGILRLAVERFLKVRGPEAAAGVAFYAVFSVIPLVLVTIAVLSIVMSNLGGPAKILDFFATALPLAQGPIRDNILPILDKGVAGGIYGIVGLTWAASGMFTTLARNINRAWPEAAVRNYIQGRLVAFGMVAVLFLLMAMWLVVTTLVSLLPNLIVVGPDSVYLYDTFIWMLVSTVIPWLVAFLVFVGIYRWLPNTAVRWKEAFWGAVFATVTWELTTLVFTWFLRSGFARYEALYGQLGTSIAVLFWIYLSALITLFGAHLSAAIARATRPKRALDARVEGESQWTHPA